MDAMRQAGSPVVGSAVMAVAVSSSSSTSKRIACVRMRAVSVVIAFVYEGSFSGRCVRVAPKGNCVHGASVAVTVGVSIEWGCNRCVCECSGNRHHARAVPRGNMCERGVIILLTV